MNDLSSTRGKKATILVAIVSVMMFLFAGAMIGESSDGYEGTANGETHTVTFVVDDGNHGTIDKPSIQVSHGERITIGQNPNELICGNEIITATPKAGFSFNEWTGDIITPTTADWQVLEDTTITATFSPEMFMICFYPGDNFANVTMTADGTECDDAVDVPYGTVVTFNGNKATFTANGREYVATATAQDGKSFESWNDSEKVVSGKYEIVGETTFHAKTLTEKHTVTFVVDNPDYGTVSKKSVQIPHGDRISVGQHPYELICGNDTVTATPKAGFSFKEWTGDIVTPTTSAWQVLGDTTITATFSSELYRVCFYPGDNFVDIVLTINGVWVEEDIDVPYGTVLTFKGKEVQFVVDGRDYVVRAMAHDGKSFDSWNDSEKVVSGKYEIVGEATFYAKTITEMHTVTFVVNNPDYGTVSETSVQIPHGDRIAVGQHAYELVCVDKIVTATPSPSTMESEFFFKEWTGDIVTPTTGAWQVLGDTTITAVFEKSPLNYFVSWSVNGSIIYDTVGEYGTVVTAPEYDESWLDYYEDSDFVFEFKGWSPAAQLNDDGTYSVTIVGNMRFDAVFEANHDALPEMNDNGDYAFDNNASQSTTVSGEVLEEIKADNVCGITVATQNGSIGFDSASVSNMPEGNLTVTMTAAYWNSMTSAQNDAVGDSPAYNITVNNGNVTALNGTATIVLNYDGSEGDDVVIVCYDDNGNAEVFNDSVYDKEAGTVSAETTHFSIYAIKNIKDISEGGVSDDDREKGMSNTLMYAGIGIAVLISILAIATYVVKSAKN